MPGTRKRVDLSLDTYWVHRDFRSFTVVAVMQPSTAVARLVIDASHRRLFISRNGASRIFPSGWGWLSTFFFFVSGCASHQRDGTLVQGTFVAKNRKGDRMTSLASLKGQP
jgi:hypothetical protein